MSYRGDDLDLRTPQTSVATGDLSGTRGGAIWVDDTVLACCNHAYDVALAHRAGEVRLEHLLNALTRIEIAAEALEARGVRVAALRRESATIIASEIPVGLPNGKGSPRRSEDFAEVLRLAAANAARRSAPASIEDLLFVLFDRIDLPGLSLLVRHAVRHVRDSEPLPRYASEPRYLPDRAPRIDAVRYTAETVRPYRVDQGATPIDNLQNSRLYALEQMVRALSADLSNERQIVSGLLRDDQGRPQNTPDRAGSDTRGSGAPQDGLQDQMLNFEASVEQRLSDLARSFGKAMERLGGIEASLEQRLAEMSRSWTVLSDRVQSLDKSLRDRPGGQALPADFFDRVRNSIDLKPVSGRLDIIEEALLSSDGLKGDGHLSGVIARVEERLKKVEDELGRGLVSATQSIGRVETLIGGMERQRGEAISAMMQPIVERVSAVVGAAQSQTAGTAETLAKLVDRVAGVEGAVTAEIETAAAKHKAYAQDLSDVHEALMKLNQNQHTLAGSIDQWRSDAAGDLSVISNRLAVFDRDNDRPFEAVKALSAHMDTMNKMMIERYHRRNRFWYWLFGTDDWIGASWPSQAAALETERNKLKAPKPL